MNSDIAFKTDRNPKETAQYLVWYGNWATCGNLEYQRMAAAYLDLLARTEGLEK